MMIDVLLIYPPYAWPSRHAPLGLAYLASYLERSGYRLKIIDMSPLGIGLKNLIRIAGNLEYKMVGISFMTPQSGFAQKIAAAIKKINGAIPIVAGGPHASAVPAEILMTGNFDFVVMGEGEETFLELTEAFVRGRGDASKINGLAFWQEGSLQFTPPRVMIEDLDGLPFPAWHLVPFDRYSVYQTGIERGRTVFTLLSSRGCPNNCLFCDSHTIFGRKFRQRSPVNIFDEIVYLKERFGAVQFDFEDDLITVNKRKLSELCDRIINAKLGITWVCNARVNTVDLEMLEHMRAAGCECVNFGVESGDELVRRAINKNITLEQIRNSHRWARQAGLKTSTFLMVGNPGEDFAAVQKTAALADEIETDSPAVSIATPFPGTQLYRLAKSNNWLYETDWSRYVTIPHILPGYKPVMRTDKMTRRQILDAYYFLNSWFFKKKLRMKYGEKPLKNPQFWRDEILKIRSLKALFGRVQLAVKLLKGIFKIFS